MKKCTIVISLLFIAGIAMSQESEIDFDRKYFSIGINGGIGENFNGYRTSIDKKGFAYYGINPHSSFGIDGGLYLTKKIRTRFELRYQEIEYGMNWPEEYADTYYKTEVSLSSLNFNVHFDYSLFAKNKFEIYVSPGLVSEYVLKDKFKNILVNGTTNTKNYNVILESYNQKIAGGNISLLAKYNIFDFVDITVTPGYTYFFQNFVLTNNKPYQRLSLNLGLEFSF